MFNRLVVAALLCASCAGNQVETKPEKIAQYDDGFVGQWIVDQPSHALYESTLYRFQPDGTLQVGQAEPPNCEGHLAKHCVTGSVENCFSSTGHCQSTLSCVFGEHWRSIDSNELIIVGKCSDGQERDIRLKFPTNASMGTKPEVVSVGEEINWSHNSWEWNFRKCEQDDPQCNSLHE